LRAFPDAPRIRQRYCFGHTLGGAGLSAQGVHKGPHDYAVVWRTGDGPTSSGRLELAEDGLVLHGAGGPEGLRIPFAELSSVEIGRGAGERINGDKSVVLERLTSTAAPKRAAVAEFPLGVVYVVKRYSAASSLALSLCPIFSITGCQDSVRPRNQRFGQDANFDTPQA
jgi:hypothetical protein